MQRLSNGTQVAALPSPIAVTGTPGYASAGNPGIGLLPSEWDADQYNRIQEEIVAVILAAGITLDPANNAQLLAALNQLHGHGRFLSLQALSSTGSITVPALATMAEVMLWAAGGGSGGSAGTGSAGSGAGGGGFAWGVYPVTGGAIISATVGQGGGPGGGSGNGNNGGASSFGTLLSATGGNGSGYGTTSGVGLAGQPGVGTGGNILNLSGYGGSNPLTNPGGTYSTSGIGGGTWGTSSSPPSSAGSPQNGNTGYFPGGGASGGINGNGGAQGANGLILVRWLS